MKKEELRIGNTIYYETEHGDLITHTVDIDSLIWLSKDEKGFNLVHTPIRLTENLLIERGFEKTNFQMLKLGDWYIDLYCNVWKFHREYQDINFEYLHQIENIYFDLTKKTLLKK